MCYKLRPHHLLCTQGYSGRGYNEKFVQRMTEITTVLRNEKSVSVDIVCSTDDICENCPLKIAEDVCKDQQKVKNLDGKVMSLFHLEEKRYNYRDLVREINSKMTAERMDYICGDCSWYGMSACKKNIVGGCN